MESPAPVLVSACRAGQPCRYDGRLGGSAVGVAGPVLAFCPEAAGGLPTPRPTAEIVGGDGADVLAGRARVVTAAGEDVTASFVSGALAMADFAAEHGVTDAVLQERSPSCGASQRYDGTFSGRLVPGTGVAAAALRARGVSVQAVD